MTFRKLLVLFVFFQMFIITEGKELSFPLYNTVDSCQFGPKLWLLDNNEDTKFDYLVYGGCPKKAKVFNLVDKSFNQPMNIQKAILINGNITSDGFLVIGYYLILFTIILE